LIVRGHSYQKDGESVKKGFAMHALALLAIMVEIASVREAGAATNLSHPRLYFTANELPQLRQQRMRGVHAKIWKNIADSADWCLTQTPRADWLAPITPDPRYENLYDRFYAIMGDLAITEHLSFAYAFSGNEKYGDAARQWALASCRAWSHEADDKPDGGKAYAVARLLKGVAVGYDIVYDRFTEAERKEIRETLTRITQKYFTDYFSTPTIAGPGFHTHHAIVEWGSFGVTALALLDETPEAKTWVDATIMKFEAHLLPTGLAEDGAQTEGGTFWASTMHYRLFFMDALRRVTGRDLFQRFEGNMNADLALASIAAEKFPGYDEHNSNVVLEPSYGQLDYYAPVLLALAREYRHPTFQYLALWDHSLGSIQHTRYITPHSEKLLFELGGYAYLWYDPTVPAKADGKKLSYQFPSGDEAYLRASWKPGDLLVGVRKGELVVHAGGQPVLIEPGVSSTTQTNVNIQSLEDNGHVAVVRCGSSNEISLTIELNRREHRLLIRRRITGNWQWWCQGNPKRDGNTLRWGMQFALTARAGDIAAFDPAGYVLKLTVGNGLLPLSDPAGQKYPLVTIHPPAGGEIIIEVKLR
jgi:uncharacterized protein DUF4962